MKIMKRFVSLIVISLLLQAMLIMPAGAENLVKNGDFEKNVSDWQTHGATISKQEGAAPDGSGAYARVTLTEPRGYAYQNVTLKKGVEYGFSAYVKLDSGQDSVQFIVDRNKAGETLQIDFIAVGTIVTTEWTKITGRYTYTGEEDMVQVKVYLRFGDGMALRSYCVDDFSIDDEGLVIEAIEPSILQDINYSDVPRDHWARSYISLMDKKGIAHGVGDGLFLPEGKVTRAEFLAMLVRALELKTKEFNGVYKDVDAEAWYAHFIETAAAHELIDGAMTPDNKFLPNQPINREEIAALSVNAYKHLGLAEPGAKKGSIDVSDVSPWAAEYVSFADRTGLMRGDSEGMRPKANTTRAEAAAIIQRLLEAQNQTIYYVDSVNGDDAARGTEFAPLKTLQGAQAALRKVNKKMQSDIYVYLCDDEYVLTETLFFDANDSGMNGFDIIWMGASGKMPLISGGQQIDGWTLHDAEKNIYKANAKGIDTRQLYINGARGVRAKSEGGLTNAISDKGVRGFISDDVFLAEFENPDDLEMVFHGDWTLPRVGVDSITLTKDGKADIVLAQPAWQRAANKGATAVDYPRWYENAYELLDAEGEWYLDKRKDTFYYKPLPGEDMETAKVIAPVIEQLMILEGKSISHPVHNISFKNLKFAHTGWLRPNGDDGHVDLQCNYMYHTGGNPDRLLCPGAIELQKGNHINFVECEFSKMGINALQYTYGMQDCIVVGNHFYDISGTAVQVGHPDPYTKEVSNPTDSRMVMRGFTVNNNYIHDVAVEYYSAVGIAIGYVGDSTFNHNEICNLPYSGFHIGYGWEGVKTSATKNTRVQHNYVHNVMTYLWDGGAIYTNGATGGSGDDYNLITHNYLKDQHDATSVMYTDAGSTYWWWERNVVSFEDSEWAEGSRKWTNGAKETCPRYWNFVPIKQMDLTSEVDKTKILDTQVYPGENWPEEAMEIIRQSGVEDKYKYLVPINYDLDKICTTAFFDMKTGDTGSMNIRAYTDRGMPYDISEATVTYVSENPEIASVDEKGNVKALAQGKTNIITTCVLGDITRTQTSSVKVDEVFDHIHPNLELGNMVVGTSRKIYMVGATNFGTELVLDSYRIESDNPEVVSVTGGDTLVANQIGSANITIYGNYGGETKEYKHTVRAITFGDDSALDYPAYPFNELKEGVSQWHIHKNARISEIKDGVATETPNLHATYTGKKFGDELITFNLKVNATSGWYGILLRASSATTGYSNAGQNTYMITFGNGGTIDLIRFNDGLRTGIFSSGGDNNIGGPARENEFFSLGTTHKFQFGAINEEDGVRIILNIDGKNVFNYLDTTEGRLEEDGYIGFLNRTGVMEITTP